MQIRHCIPLSEERGMHLHPLHPSPVTGLTLNTITIALISPFYSTVFVTLGVYEVFLPKWGSIECIKHPSTNSKLRKAHIIPIPRPGERWACFFISSVHHSWTTHFVFFQSFEKIDFVRSQNDRAFSMYFVCDFTEWSFSKIVCLTKSFVQ